MEITEVIRKPVITEKSTQRVSINQYTFEVAKGATKNEIAAAVEKMFGVEVWKVRVMNRRGKKRRVGRARKEVFAPAIRRAVVTINPKNRIDLFEVAEEVPEEEEE